MERFFSEKYRYREMILYIVIYKCVQRRKYIKGFSQWGSMHELFLKMMTGERTLYLSMHVSQIYSNHIRPLWILVFVLPHRRRKITGNFEITQQVLFTSQRSFIKKKSHCHKSQYTVKATYSSIHPLLHNVIYRCFSIQVM